MGAVSLSVTPDDITLTKIDFHDLCAEYLPPRDNLLRRDESGLQLLDMVIARGVQMEAPLLTSFVLAQIMNMS